MEEVVIVEGVRTATGAFGKSLKNIEARELGRQMLNGLMQKTAIDKADVDEVIFGHGYVHGGGLNSARISSQLANFPKETPAYIVIKACGSSLKAITNGALAIKAGEESIVIAGGVESMSNAPYLVKNRWNNQFGHKELIDSLLGDGLTCSFGNEHMGVTAERLADMYEITREEQDIFAYESHKKAIKAIESNKFHDEIIPVEYTNRGEKVSFTHDESVRENIDLGKLNNLPTVFKKGGLITAGNACPMNDGAAGVLMLSATESKKRNLEPLVKIKAFASTGVDPSIMGIGPVSSTQKALEKAGLNIEDIGLIELNEAFAAQALAVIKELGLDKDKVNVNGGAIALGHPVGATGAKLTVSLINEMIRSQERYGLVTMCMGGGMGITVIYENMRL